MKKARFFAGLTGLATLLGVMALIGVSHAGPQGRFVYQPERGQPPLSGAADYRLMTATGPDVTGQPAPLAATDDIQVNGENKADPNNQFGSGAGFPQNETSIAINPTDPLNVIGGANDYEYAVDSIGGVYASFDGGHTWPYSTHIPTVITPDRDWLGSGDPAVTFDTEGVAYYATINFARSTCDSWIAVSRSVNKGVNWTAPVGSESIGTGLQVGDGIVAHNGGDDDCQIFHDKEYIAAGPRPEGAPLVPGTDLEHLSPDRVYVTWTVFDFGPAGDTYLESPIVVAYSDDQGRHWSAYQEISGSAPFCHIQSGDQDGDCDEDQFSVPVVDQDTGDVYVAFLNYQYRSSTKIQYLVVRSSDGGQTWSGPFKVANVVAGNYPTCPLTGSQTLDEMCARVNQGGNIDIDPTTGDLWITWSDNRNGSVSDTNTDVFVTRSTNGGSSWASVVNLTSQSDDDQWFPWLSVSPTGTVAVVYFDKRYAAGQKLYDASLSYSTDGGGSVVTVRLSEVSSNPDLTFRLGIFMGDYNGLDTTASTALPFWADGRSGEPPVRGNNPYRPQSDVVTDVEPIA
ncbi:sialidase family protein [soil metagenome]